MGAPAILRDVFNDFQARFGPEDDGFLFEDEGGPLERVDVLVYRGEVTTFLTVGMAGREQPAAPGPGGGGRTELRLRRRGRLERAEEGAIAVRLANLAVHPFVTGDQLNWGHMIGSEAEFPAFPGCRAVFLAGPLSAGDLDYVRTGVEAVRIVNVVPITDEERAFGRTVPPIEFAQQLIERVDVLAPRLS